MLFCTGLGYGNEQTPNLEQEMKSQNNHSGEINGSYPVGGGHSGGRNARRLEWFRLDSGNRLGKRRKVAHYFGNAVVKFILHFHRAPARQVYQW